MKSVVFEREIRRFVRSCLMYSHGDAWIENLKKDASAPTLKGMTGNYPDLINIMRSEVEICEDFIKRERNREREIKEIQTARNNNICPMGGERD